MGQTVAQPEGWEQFRQRVQALDTESRVREAMTAYGENVDDLDRYDRGGGDIVIPVREIRDGSAPSPTALADARSDRWRENDHPHYPYRRRREDSERYHLVVGRHDNVLSWTEYHFDDDAERRTTVKLPVTSSETEVSIAEEYSATERDDSTEVRASYPVTAGMIATVYAQVLGVPAFLIPA